MAGRTMMPAVTGSSRRSVAGGRDGALSARAGGGNAVVFAPKLRSAGLRPGLVERPRDLLEEARVLLAQCAGTGIIGDLVPEVAQALSASHRRGQDWADLTDRELSVLRLLELGLSQRQIAQELFLSFHTVHSHTKSIYTRLGVTSRDEAIRRARELELL